MQEAVPSLTSAGGVASNDAEVTPDRRKKSFGRVALVVKIIISGGLIVFLMMRHAPHTDDIKRFELAPFIAALVVIGIQLLLNAMRWRILLKHCAENQKTYWRQFKIYYASVFFAQILPSIGSDIVRALYYRKLGASLGRVSVSILLDRGIAIAALLLLVLMSLPFLAHFDGRSPFFWSIAVLSGGALAAAYIGCALVKIMQSLPIWRRLPAPVCVLAADITWVLTSHIALTRVVPLSIIVHLMSVVALMLVALSFHVPMSLASALTVGPAYLVAQVIPISIGGWGVREAAAVVLFAAVGIPAASAMLISVAFGVIILIASLPGALSWLLLRD
ncbi:MAG TPA: lysylphosphatidylglycerol synthase transmembrane domain-containing protein [Parvibaculum sp.]|jgi:hypothetical protein